MNGPQKCDQVRNNREARKKGQNAQKRPTKKDKTSIERKGKEGEMAEK